MTRYAIISDIHGNAEAMGAVAADIGRRPIDCVICCGDVVGYGAEPDLCISKVRELLSKYGEIPHVMGNHDNAVVTGNIVGFTREASFAAQWTHANISSEGREWLAQSVMTCGDGDILFVHGSPTHPEEWNYLWTPEQVIKEYPSFEEQICFVGHTHRPFIHTEGSRRFAANTTAFRVPPDVRCLVNIGSVGQPRDGNSNASYCVYDDEQRLISIRRVPYDVASAARKIFQTDGVPDILGERLMAGF